MRRVLASAILIVLIGSQAADAKSIVGAYTTDSGVGAQAKNETSQPAAKVSATDSPPPCSYSTIKNDPGAVISNPDGSVTPIYDSTHPSTAGTWLWKQCTDPTGTVTSLNTVWFPTASPTALAQQAIADQALPVPAASVSPPLPGGAIVNYPTWLWVDADSWRGITATAAVDGLSVTATASPQSTVWNMGDGHSVTCTGPGTPYDTTKSSTDQHSDCTYVFTRSSANEPGKAFSVTATAQWAATWRASDGTSGNLGTIARTTTMSLPVREIQAVNIAPTGSR